jgi:GT2 family glycosyltransferase
VDNASTDNTVSFVKSELPEIVVVAADRNLGYAGGMNLALQSEGVCNSEYVLLLNNDVIVEPRAIQNLVRACQDPGVGAAVPKTYAGRPGDGPVLWHAGADFEEASGQGYHVGIGEVDNGQYAARRDIGYGPGSALMVKTSAISAAGGFDERYFLYCEDLDLSRRLIRMGFRIVYEPAAVAWHAPGSSSPGRFGRARRTYYKTRNSLLFLHVHTGRKPLRRSVVLLVKGLGRAMLRHRDGLEAAAVIRGVTDFYRSRFGMCERFVAEHTPR